MKTPNTLEEAFEELKTGEGIEAFAKGSEKEAGRVHHSLGQCLRNEWGLWGGTNDLCQFFNSIGIKHADDISGIIILSFHRHLNNKDINLKKQVLTYWKHWAKYGEEFLPPNITGISEEYLEHYNNTRK